MRNTNFLQFVDLFDESGFEIYETVTPVFVDQNLEDETSPAGRRRLEVRDVLSGLQAKFYELEAAVKDLPGEQADRALARWIYTLGQVTGGVRKTAVEELVREVPEHLLGGTDTQEERALERQIGSAATESQWEVHLGAKEEWAAAVTERARRKQLIRKGKGKREWAEQFAAEERAERGL